jgi:dipeptidyl aminopeptidase/acylaminoacyl peptidase
MKKIFTTILLLLTNSYWLIAQKNVSVGFEQVISLRQCGNPVISPNGDNVAFTVTTTDWKENGYDTEIWLSIKGVEPFQLTRTTKGSSTSPKWSPDGKWLAFVADRGDKTQIFAIRELGGEAQAITKEEEGILNYEWSPKGKILAFTKNEPEGKKLKNTKERYGGFAFDDEEYSLSHLWMVDFQPDIMPAPNEKPCNDTKDSTKKNDCITLPKPTRLTDGKFTVTNFGWSPDGTYIAFSHQPTPLLYSSMKSDISMVEVSSKKVSLLVKNPTGDNFIAWSPDAKEILFQSTLNDSTSNFYKNNRLFKIAIKGGNTSELASTFDENKNVVDWNAEGIFFQSNQRANGVSLFMLNPVSNTSTPVAGLTDFVGSMSFSINGKQMAFLGRDANSLQEVYQILEGKLLKLTSFNKQVESWNTSSSEIVKWKSKDGTEIEGVLHKPKNFDRSKKYPLLIVIHGGPTGIDTPTPIPGSVYPIIQWVEKGAIVLRPNYRGSAGYGEKFRSLNVRNLGIGDMDDVMSGVDFLEKQGFVDSNKMGCMGWSQGGYISAFLTTNTTRFKAISVGAGISNWVTYYVSTDIHPFTRQYLQADPWKDPEIYRKTSPMSNILNAKTPTLIQHGEFDKRVPISNAYELLQGLQDVGVPAKLVVYKGFGHGITKPKERLAAIWHNYQWFGKYIFNENIDIPTE